MADYTFLPNLNDEVELPADDRIVSRKIATGPWTKATLFGFAEGQELTEHTSTRPAMLHFLEGEARITLGDDAYDVSAGAWAVMPPNLPHSIFAKTPVRMLLVMIAG